MSLKIDRAIMQAEDSLSGISRFPVIGTCAGATKVVMGVAQTIMGIVYGILSLIPSIVSSNSWHLEWAWTHIKHGLGNITAGSLESIPIIQTGLFYLRNGIHQADNPEIYFSNGQERKFMPYSSLVNETCCISGRDQNAIQRAYFFIEQMSTYHPPNLPDELTQTIRNGNPNPYIPKFEKRRAWEMSILAHNISEALRTTGTNEMRDPKIIPYNDLLNDLFHPERFSC